MNELPLLFSEDVLLQLQAFDKIFVLVSGGIDSTYLWEVISERYPEKAYPVNCYNPYETNDALRQISKHPRFIQIKPDQRIDYAEVLKDSFMRIPRVARAIRLHKYEKKMFPCCRIIKHEAFKEDPAFKEPGTVVISGIKANDGKIRGWFLKDLRYGTRPGSPEPGIPSWFWRHKGGQLYCYPFRDYKGRYLPAGVIEFLRKKYPGLDHSGCSICPVVVVWKLKHAKNYKRSIDYWHNLGGYAKLDDFQGFKPCTKKLNMD